MSEIKVYCPFCMQKLAIDAECIGMVAECPSCQQQFTITAPEPDPAPAPTIAPAPVPQSRPAISRPAPSFEQKPQNYNSSPRQTAGRNTTKPLAGMSPKEKEKFQKSMRKYFSLANASSNISLFKLLKRLFLGNEYTTVVRQLEAEKKHFQKEFSEWVGVDAGELSFAEPITFAGYNLSSENGTREINDTYLYFACDKEVKNNGKKEWCSPVAEIAQIAFSEHALYCATKYVSFVSDTSKYTSEEYFYSDIVNVKVERLFQQCKGRGLFGFLQNLLRKIPVIKWFIPKVRFQMKEFNRACIETASGSGISFYVPSGQRESILAMKNLIRQRKMTN